MIILTEIQKRLYSQLLDAITKNDIVMINALMRFGKTALVVFFANEQNFKRIAIITDQEYKGYQKLLQETNLKEDEQVFFFRSTQINQILNPDLIIVDDIEQYLNLEFECKKIYMCGVLNDSFTQNIKSIISYTYSDYLKDGQTPIMKIFPGKKDILKTIQDSQKLDLMKKYLILVIGQKKNTFDKLQELKNEFMLMYSDNYYDIRNIIQKSQKNTILCTQKLVKNVSIPLCQVVIIQETLEPIQAAFRCMMFQQEKQFSYTCFMKKSDEQIFRNYFKGTKFD